MLKPNFYYTVISYGSYRKIIQTDFEICKGCFSQFYADIKGAWSQFGLKFIFTIFYQIIPTGQPIFENQSSRINKQDTDKNHNLLFCKQSSSHIFVYIPSAGWKIQS